MPPEILPHDPLVRHHAWSDDPARDRAVRLAEDGVERRPTLEEAIAGVFENKGESMSGIFHIDTEVTMKDEKHPEGMNTERCKLTAERDAAIRERESLQEQLESVACRAATAENRVAELEAEKADRLRLDTSTKTTFTMYQEDSAVRAAAEGMDVGTLLRPKPQPAPAAEPVANSSADPNGSAEPVAWGVEIKGHTRACYFTKYWADRLAEEEKGTVVPLFAASPQPRGWLTEKERRVLSETADVLDDRKANAHARVLRALLARNSPPVVKLPEPTERRSIPVFFGFASWEAGARNERRKILAALADAGVEVK